MYSDENYVIRKETWYTTIDYVGKETSVRVPADLEDDHGCFRDHEEIEEIIYTNGNKTLNGFSGCKNLKRLFVSATVEKLGYQPFESCESLTEVTIDPNNAHFTAENSLILSKDGEKLLYCVPGITGTVIVPNSVRCIESNAFSDCRKIEKIVLPKELESIEGYAFGNCVNLKEINLPEKINTLPDYCFIGCKSLDKIDLSHVTCLRKGAFDSCKSLRVTVPANVDVIYEGAFAGCTLKNLRFEEGAGLICYGQGAFAESVQVKKKLKTHPNLPLHLFNKPALKLWLVMGFCTDPEVYSGYIKKEYEQYAKSQKKRILKKALEDKQTKVLSYYGESAPETTPEVSRESEGQISLSMTNEQAKQLFKFSKRKTGISINEFKGINSVWRSQSVYDSDFLEGVSNKLILPEYIDGEPVGHIALTVLPDNAVVFCSDIVFQKLKRSVRTSTACAYLENSTEFPEKECSEIQKYIAKYSADVADKLIETANVQAVSRFLELVKLTPKLCDEMLKKAEGNVELTALILERKYAQCNSL